MEKSERLGRKIKRFLRQLGCPRWLHHYGPKTYQLWQHVCAFVCMAALRLSLRRVVYWLSLFGIDVPSYSALCKSRKRIPHALLQRALAFTAGATHSCVAIDSTGISRTNPSHHYVKRIDRITPVKSYVKQSSLFDVGQRKFVALQVKLKPRHDLLDAKHLLKGQQCRTLLADKAYDAEFLHEYCWKRDIHANIKPKLWAQKGWYRRKQRRLFDEQLYHQRSLIESGQSAMKRKYGGFTLAKRIESIRTEAYCKAIAYNMRLLQQETFNRAPKNRNLFNAISPSRCMAEKKPEWVKMKPSEVEAVIVELAKKGETPEKIGLILRDKHGIPKVKLVGKRIMQIIKAANIKTETQKSRIDSKIKVLEAHIAKNKHDYSAGRSLGKSVWTANRLKD